jgi:hypothetical protein
MLPSRSKSLRRNKKVENNNRKKKRRRRREKEGKEKRKKKEKDQLFDTLRKVVSMRTFYYEFSSVVLNSTDTLIRMLSC